MAYPGIAGMDHNLLSNRSVGDPHPQYQRIGAPLKVTIGGSSIAPPLLLDGTGLGPMTYLWILDDAGNDLASFYYSTVPALARAVEVFVGGLGSFTVFRSGTATPTFSVRPDIVPSGVYMFLDTYAASNMIVAGQQRHVDETYTFSSSPVNPLPLPTKHIVRLDPGISPRVVQGITADVEGPTYGDTVVYEFINIAAFGSGYNISWENESSTLAVDRVITGTGSTVVLGPQQTFRIYYDRITQRWRILS